MGHEIDPTALTCDAIADCLDQIAQVGPDTVLMQVAQQVGSSLSLSMTGLRLEHSTWDVEHAAPDLCYLHPVERTAPHTWDLLRLIDSKTGLPSAQDSRYVSCDSADLARRGARHAAYRGTAHL